MSDTLEAFVPSDSNEIKDTTIDETQVLEAKIESLENEVSYLKTEIKSLVNELHKAERKAYSGLGD